MGGWIGRLRGVRGEGVVEVVEVSGRVVAEWRCVGRAWARELKELSSFVLHSERFDRLG
jgi:hypothetical protein